MQQSLRTPEAAALGLAPPPRRGAASLVRPPAPAADLSLLVGRNPATASALLGASSLPQGLSNSISALGGLDREGLGANPTLYRALLNQRLQQEESAALAAAGLGATGLGGAATGGLTGAGLLGRTNTSLLSRPSDTRGSPVRMSGDSIRQAMMREQTIAQAAAANALANEDGPAAKRLKSRLSS